jgi:hypothetical protein
MTAHEHANERPRSTPRGTPVSTRQERSLTATRTAAESATECYPEAATECYPEHATTSHLACHPEARPDAIREAIPVPAGRGARAQEAFRSRRQVTPRRGSQVRSDDDLADRLRSLVKGDPAASIKSAAVPGPGHTDERHDVNTDPESGVA